MYGNFTFPNLPYRPDAGAGFDSGLATVLPTGANVTYLRSTGPADYDPPALTGRILSTLAAALAQCRSGKADTICVLPGHSELVFTDNTILSGLVADTRILGFGRGASMPTFRITNTAGTMLLNKANVMLSGLRLKFDGANGITRAMYVTAADNAIVNCDIIVATGATAKCAIMCEATTGGDGLVFAGNRVRGTATHNMTNGLVISAAIDNVQITDNTMLASATAGNGLVNITGAATKLEIGRNKLVNDHTSSTAAINFAAVASTGIAYDNYCGTLVDGGAAAAGIIIGSGCLVRLFNNQSADVAGESGVLAPLAGD